MHKNIMVHGNQVSPWSPFLCGLLFTKVKSATRLAHETGSTLTFEVLQQFKLDVASKISRSYKTNSKVPYSTLER